MLARLAMQKTVLQLLGAARRVRVRDIVVDVVELEAGGNPLGIALPVISYSSGNTITSR